MRHALGLDTVRGAVRSGEDAQAPGEGLEGSWPVPLGAQQQSDEVFLRVRHAPHPVGSRARLRKSARAGQTAQNSALISAVRALRTRSSCDPPRRTAAAGGSCACSRSSPAVALHQVDEPQEGVLDVAAEDVEVGDQASGRRHRWGRPPRPRGRPGGRRRRCAASGRPGQVPARRPRRPGSALSACWYAAAARVEVAALDRVVGLLVQRRQGGSSLVVRRRAGPPAASRRGRSRRAGRRGRATRRASAHGLARRLDAGEQRHRLALDQAHRHRARSAPGRRAAAPGFCSTSTLTTWSRPS